MTNEKVGTRISQSLHFFKMTPIFAGWYCETTPHFS
jgi:hypothetical protein